MAASFWNLDVVRKALELAKRIYRLTERFPRAERFRLVDQICSAAISVGANLAEGEGRFTRPDQIRFLHMARGSINELELLLRLALELSYLSAEEARDLDDRCSEVARMTNGLIRAKRNL